VLSPSETEDRDEVKVGNCAKHKNTFLLLREEKVCWKMSNVITYVNISRTIFSSRINEFLH
jgi:hypothetical protein